MYSEYGWVRVAVAVPEVTVAQPLANAEFMLACLEDLAPAEPDLVVFPELCLTGYTCGDLFHQNTLRRSTLSALEHLLAATADCQAVLAVGLPLTAGGQLFNCAMAVQAGRVLGVVPKSVIPNYREFYEGRWFAAAAKVREDTVQVGDRQVPFGTDLVFAADSDPRFSFGLEICEDLWAPIPPSTRLALGGAAILLNLSASHELVGKSAYREELVRQQSARCLAAYAYCSAGPLESTTDLVFGGHGMIAENGTILQQSPRFRRGRHTLIADVDLEFLQHERMQNHAFNSQVGEPDLMIRRLPFKPGRQPAPPEKLYRSVPALPFVPSNPSRRRQRSQEIIAIQSHGLATRLHRAGVEKAVLGLSGGLDSTLALLVAREAFAHLRRPPTNIRCFTMPGFGTSQRTLEQVRRLTRETGVELAEIDIRSACEQHFRDLGHDGTTGDTTFENAQARERMQILMDKANMLGALVIGTGDLSELALGWTTYNGDHMSMYNVNAGVPKTLVSWLIRDFADTLDPDNAGLRKVLMDILDTPISPELLPPDQDGNVGQQTEALIGPYQLHDFFLYHMVRCGFTPQKVLFMAAIAFADQYKRSEIKQWLEVFATRFFAHQFKRSCLPDGPKVGTIALSPRGDWRMPSDVRADTWLAELAEAES